MMATTGRCLAACAVMILGAGMSMAQSNPISLMPLPAKMQQTDGALPIDSGFHISFSGYREARLDRAAQRAMTELHRETGIPFLPKPAAATSGTALEVTTDHESKAVQELGE